VSKRRVWVLDTATKGTGAEMVPLDSIVKNPAPTGERLFVPPKRPPRPPKGPEPRKPRTFKIVDVTTREVLAEGTGARATLDVLSAVRSIVDVNVFVWEPTSEHWRLLTLGEQRVLWERRAWTRGAASP
jgi:hypothetical protein